MDTRAWQFFDCEWDYDASGEFGGHMPQGFGLDTEMEPVELSERTSDALFDEWATGIYSSDDDRSRVMESLLLQRIGVRVPGFVNAYVARKYPAEGQDT